MMSGRLVLVIVVVQVLRASCAPEQINIKTDIPEVAALMKDPAYLNFLQGLFASVGNELNYTTPTFTVSPSNSDNTVASNSLPSQVISVDVASPPHSAASHSSAQYVIQSHSTGTSQPQSTVITVTSQNVSQSHHSVSQPQQTLITVTSQNVSQSQNAVSQPQQTIITVISDNASKPKPVVTPPPPAFTVISQNVPQPQPQPAAQPVLVISQPQPAVVESKPEPQSTVIVNPLQALPETSWVSGAANPNVVVVQTQQDIEKAPVEAKNAKYYFASIVDDNINGQYQHREERRDGLKTTGYYAYDDGYYRRGVYYEADENGFRVTKEEVSPSVKTRSTLNGVVTVKTILNGREINYSYTKDQLVGTKKWV